MYRKYPLLFVNKSNFLSQLEDSYKAYVVATIQYSILGHALDQFYNIYIMKMKSRKPFHSSSQNVIGTQTQVEYQGWPLQFPTQLLQREEIFKVKKPVKCSCLHTAVPYLISVNDSNYSCFSKQLQHQVIAGTCANVKNR